MRDSRGQFPLDKCILVPTGRALSRPLGDLAQCVLDHVDGVRSLRDIAAKCELGISDAIQGALELLASGAADAWTDCSPPSLPRV